MRVDLVVPLGLFFNIPFDPFYLMKKGMLFYLSYFSSLTLSIIGLSITGFLVETQM